MLDFARQLRFGSAVNYIIRRIVNRESRVVVHTRIGPKFELRFNFSGNNDYGVAYEVFVHDYYSDRGRLRRDDVELVVDLGANVGYSTLYFLHHFHQCRVIAFEPHPGHAAQVIRNLQLDGSLNRVEIHKKAAGASQRVMRLTDETTSSTLTERIGADTLPVEVVDVFPMLSGRRIDILKMDVEGGEYEILADDRFATLNVGAVVMEWHSRGQGLEDKRWCESRLQSLGFVIDEIFSQPGYGMFWARRAVKSARQ
jgi:FkbM family methyltransferase